MNAAGIIERINRDRGTAYRIVEPSGSGESGAAWRVNDDLGNRYVLKIGAGSEFRAEDAARTTQRLRCLGYPAPEYAVVGNIAQTAYSLQRMMLGEPIGSRLHPRLLPQLLHLNELQCGQGESENDGPDRIIGGVIEGYPDFCIIGTLRTYSVESAALLNALQRMVTEHASECPKRNDIIHFDFHTNNILMDDDRVTGVIDWEGSGSGDCAFDLVTLLFYTWSFADFREALWCALLERTTRGAVVVYLAHMIVRQLDWSMRHHDKATVDHYLQDVHDIVRALHRL